MKWLNTYKLPEPFAALVSEDLYNEERKKQFVAYCERENLPIEQVHHFSASDLIRAPRQRILVKRHFDEIISDVASHVYRVLGTAIHTALRLSSQRMTVRGIPGYIAEERLFTHMIVAGRLVVISGEPDLITPDGWIHDYKVAAVGALSKGIKTEWEQATNIYAWLRMLKGELTRGILITFILRDWKQSNVMQLDYPQAGAQTMEVVHWKDESALAYVLERVNIHLAAEGFEDDRLPECTAHEMWERPECWAVIREDGARAAKLYKGEDFPPTTDREIILAAANADAVIRNKVKPKKGEKAYIVTHRLGERVRCEKFCDARQFCSQFKEYAAVKFRG